MCLLCVACGCYLCCVGGRLLLNGCCVLVVACGSLFVVR